MRASGQLRDRLVPRRYSLGDISAQVLRARFVKPDPLLRDGRVAQTTSGFRTGDRPGHDGANRLYPLLSSDHAVKPYTDGKGRWWFPPNSSTLAIADGTVLYSQDIASGGYVYIRHADGVSSEYLHMSRRDVRPGQTVRKGQPVGVTGPGNTGLVHNHIQMRENGVLVDPTPYLAQMPAIPDPRDPQWLQWVAIAIAGYYLYKHVKGSRRS
jgi:murein DD-endopeptidase MepM/ murein hydrolase activator NlpD